MCAAGGTMRMQNGIYKLEGIHPTQELASSCNEVSGSAFIGLELTLEH